MIKKSVFFLIFSFSLLNTMVTTYGPFRASPEMQNIVVVENETLSTTSVVASDSPAPAEEEVAVTEESNRKESPMTAASDDTATLVEEDLPKEEDTKEEPWWKKRTKRVFRWLPSVTNWILAGMLVFELFRPSSTRRARSTDQDDLHQGGDIFNDYRDFREESFQIRDPMTGRWRQVDPENDSKHMVWCVGQATPPEGAVIFLPRYPYMMRWEENRELFEIQEETPSLLPLLFEYARDPRHALNPTTMTLILSAQEKMAREERDALSAPERDQIYKGAKKTLAELTLFIKGIFKKRQKALDDEYIREKNVQTVHWKQPFSSYLAASDEHQLQTLLRSLVGADRKITDALRTILDTVLTRHIKSKRAYMPPHGEKLLLTGEQIQRVLQEQDKSKKSALLKGMLPCQSLETITTYVRGFENLKDPDAKCALCLNEVHTLSDTPMLMLPCGHIVCEDCLHNKIESEQEAQKYNCAECRASFSRKKMVSFTTPHVTT